MRFLIFLFVILVIAGSLTYTFWPDYQYDFLVSFLINLFNTVSGYIVSKKYFNSDNSTFYQMIYGTMFIRFISLLSLILFLINYNYVDMIPFFISFVCFYVLFQIFEISSLINFNRENKK